MGITDFTDAEFSGKAIFVGAKLLGRTLFVGEALQRMFCEADVNFRCATIEPLDALVFRDARPE